MFYLVKVLMWIIIKLIMMKYVKIKDFAKCGALPK
tara:strand:+ start:36 stop:140 length:105 start_codon:yes stop_codon:yes gene_type:complete